MEKEMYFALWAEDICHYLYTGYNSRSLNKVHEALLSYVSVDQDNPENISSASIHQLLQMTGLSLDVSCRQFEYKDQSENQTLQFRRDNQVHYSYLK